MGPARPGNSRLGFAAIAAVITLMSFVNALAFASRLAQTSDSASGFVAGHAIAGGNVLLSGWHFPLDDYYFTDAIPYGLLEAVFGPRPFLLVLVPALTYALFVPVALLVCFEREKPLTANLVGGATIALLLATPSWTGQWNPLLLSDMHMATVLAAFVALVLCAHIARAENTPFAAAAALVVITCATLASDPFALVFAFGPATAFLLAEAVMHRRSRGVWLALMLLAAGILAGVLLPRMIAQTGGFATESDILTRPQTLSLLTRNLVAVAMGTLSLFGANPLRVGTGFRDFVLLALRGGGLFLAVVALLRTMRRALKTNETAILDRMLCASIVTVFVACVLSAQFAKGITPQNLWTGGPPMRFLVPGFLFATVLAGRQAPEMFPRLPGARIRGLFAAAAALIVLGAVWWSHLDEQPPWMGGNAPAMAARWLQQRGLLEGTGEYWSANLVTAMSGNAVQVRSVVPESGRLVPYVWVEDARWYKQPPQFVIWEDNNKTGVTSDEVRATYRVGRIATVAGYRIARLSVPSGAVTARGKSPAPGLPAKE
jgi:hypothetical protein